MDKIKNEIIVVGKDHYNALSVIRSLGKSNIKSIFIWIENDPCYYSFKSKYIKKVIKVSGEENLVHKLLEMYKEYKYKPILIPTGDPIEKILDENYDKLSKYYYLPNINNKQGEIVKYMDKTMQEELCKKFNIKIAKSFLINTKIFAYKKSYPNKVILKPYISAEGKKSDIVIAEGKEDIIKSVKVLEKAGYKKLMMQEFINYDMEYAMMGISYKGDVLIPGINSNDYIYPSDRGNTSYATMFPFKDFSYDISSIIKMISSLNYTGLFEVEMFKVNNDVYFNEINFRNSANLFGYYGDKINYVLLYVKQLLNLNINNDKKYVTKKYNFCIESHHFKNIFEHKINIFKYLFHVGKSTKILFVLSDLKPYFFKLFYAIKKKLCRRNNGK